MIYTVVYIMFVLIQAKSLIGGVLCAPRGSRENKLIISFFKNTRDILKNTFIWLLAKIFVMYTKYVILV